MAASFVALWYKIVPFKGASAFIFSPTKLLTPGQESCETIFWFSVQYYVCKFGHEAHLRLLWFCLYGFGSRTFTRNEKTDQGARGFVKNMCCEDVFVSRFLGESRYHRTNLAGISNLEVLFDNLWICETLPWEQCHFSQFLAIYKKLSNICSENLGTFARCWKFHPGPELYMYIFLSWCSPGRPNIIPTAGVHGKPPGMGWCGFWEAFRRYGPEGREGKKMNWWIDWKFTLEYSRCILGSIFQN